MILATAHGDREIRSLFAGADRIPTPGQYGGSYSNAGRRVTFDDATGLPAALRATRLIAETVGMMPLDTIRVTPVGDPDEPVASPQAQVFAGPNDMQTPFMAWSYAVVSLLRGGAYLLKRKARGRVEELFVMDPRCITPRIADGELVFDVRENGRTTTLTRSDVIYIPGLILDSPVIGCSIVRYGVHALGGALGLEEFKNRFFADDATPPTVITGLPSGWTSEQTEEFRRGFEGRHRGTSRRVGLLKGDAQLHTLGVTPQDAELIQALKFSVQDIARIYGVPSGLLGDTDAPSQDSPEVENMRFLTYGLGPWMHRLEQGLHADDDLFPQKTLKPRFRPDELLRVDFRTRAEASRMMRQAGIATANELRPGFGFGPHADGDELQATPVGGAPNAGQGDTPSEPQDPSS